MTTPYGWKEAYKAAVLETDWGKMPERIQTAESAILARQQTLSQDHGGTPEEKQALEDALNSIKTLRRDAAVEESAGFREVRIPHLQLFKRAS